MKKILRVMVLAEIVFDFAGIVTDFLLEKTFPKEMQEYIISSEVAEINFTFSLGLICSVLLMVLLIIAWVGLWRLWRPARLLYTICWVLGPLLYLVIGPVVYYSPLGATFSDYSIISAGIILGVIYFSELNTIFRKNRTEQAH